MRILGHGYLARRKSFKKMSHALQLIYISQIVKADFNSDVLRLKGRLPEDLNTIFLDLFKSKVLFPLFKTLFAELARYPK